jgi:hypothetical protein
MKNIQIIDRAQNCTFSIFQATEEEFRAIFVSPCQDIEFAEDLSERAVELLASIWERPIEKRNANGVHGTLFYDFASRRSLFPASKQEKDWDPRALNPAQRRLYGLVR